MIKNYLLEQVRLHPSGRPRDIIKHCYQAAYGAEHLLTDPAVAYARLQEEYNAVTPKKCPIYEALSDEVCRVNLAAWKERGLPLEWLFRIFTASAMKQGDLLQNLQEAEELALFPAAEWQRCMEEYRAAGMPAVHHGPEYREQEQPAYRLADRRFLRLLPILEAAAKFTGEVCVIAIDGRAASGKSTAGEQLQKIMDAELLHMDDFFLPIPLRTPERLAEPGGNVHYERFAEEVLPHLAGNAPFQYRIFDCSRMGYNGARPIGTKRVRIVEGSYSCHPQFGDYADITVFSDISPEEQQHRILLRNGEEMLAMFRDRWIPLEERYFDHFRIAGNADIII